MVSTWAFLEGMPWGLWPSSLFWDHHGSTRQRGIIVSRCGDQIWNVEFPTSWVYIAQFDKDFQEVSFKDANGVYRKSIHGEFRLRHLLCGLEERGADQLVACEDSEAASVFPSSTGRSCVGVECGGWFLGVRKVRARLVWSSSHIFWNSLFYLVVTHYRDSCRLLPCSIELFGVSF